MPLRRSLPTLLLLLACSPPSRVPPPPATPSLRVPPSATASPDEIPQTPRARLILAHAGSLGGRLEAENWGTGEGGGLGRRATYLAWLRARHPSIPVLHFETGDSMSSGAARAEALVDALAWMGVEAYNVAGRELDQGFPAFARLAARERVPFVSTNLVLEGGAAVVPRYRLLRRTDSRGRALRVLVLGVGDWGPRGRAAVAFADFRDPVAALGDALGELRGIADYTILLAGGFDARKLACRLLGLEGIDLVLSGSGEIEPYKTMMDACGQHVSLGGYGGFWITDIRILPAPQGATVSPLTALLDRRLPEEIGVAAIVSAAPAGHELPLLPRVGEREGLGRAAGAP